MIKSINNYSGIILASKIQDTVKKIKNNNLVKNTIGRDNLWISETPQIFRYSILKKCYEMDLKFFRYTDESELLENNGFRVGVIGVSDLIPAHIIDVKKRPFVETANKVIAEIESQVDFVVLLANVQRKEINGLAQNFPGADYIFISRDTKRSRPESKQPEGGPYIYNSGIQGKYLTVVEISLQNPRLPIVDISMANGKISSITRRLMQLQKKDPDNTLEEIYADKPNVLKLVGDYRQQLVKYETIMAEAVNTTNYESIALSKSVGEDAELLAFVDETLATCNALRKKTIKASKNIIKPKKSPIFKKTNSIN